MLVFLDHLLALEFAITIMISSARFLKLKSFVMYVMINVGLKLGALEEGLYVRKPVIERFP